MQVRLLAELLSFGGVKSGYRITGGHFSENLGTSNIPQEHRCTFLHVYMMYV